MLRLPIEDFASRTAFFDQWKVKKWVGLVTLDFLKRDGEPYVQLTCASSSWAFVKKLDRDLSSTPILTWSWKVDEMPKGSDGRKNETDDEAAQMYVFFHGTGLLASVDARIVGYTWEDVPEDGTFYTSPKNAKTKVFVLRDRKDGLGVWKSESRDVLADFRKAFGVEPHKADAICFQIDSDDTKTSVRSDFADIGFGPR